MKRARLDVALCMLGSTVPVFLDHGLEIVEIERTGFAHPVPPMQGEYARSVHACRLVVEGASLPDFCEVGASTEAGPLVTMVLTVEHYGSQRMTKISRIERVDAQAMEAA